MFYATKIHMNNGCKYSDKCVDIDTIYLEGGNAEQFYKKGSLHDFLLENPNSIKVKDASGPFLQGAVSVNKEKYVRSEANDTTKDNLLSLPRD